MPGGDQRAGGKAGFKARDASVNQRRFCCGGGHLVADAMGATRADVREAARANALTAGGAGGLDLAMGRGWIVRIQC